MMNGISIESECELVLFFSGRFPFYFVRVGCNEVSGRFTNDSDRFNE